MFTGKTEKYRIFPKKSKKQKNPEEKQKRDNSQQISRKINPVSNILKSKANI